MKYPESVKIVMREAPLGYAIAACWEYRNKIKTAPQILKQWYKDKDRILSTSKEISREPQDDNLPF